MALCDAILVLLTEQPMSGYDLAKRFDSSIGFFWTADHPQIYRELGRLKGKGYVDVDEVPQSGRPNKLVYSITSAGLSALHAWSQKSSLAPPIKDDLLVRFYALENVDRDALRAQLMERVDHHSDRLRKFKNILDRYYSDQKLSLSQNGKLVGLRAGLRYEQFCIDWCEEALRSIPGSTQAKSPVVQIRGKPRAG